MRITTNYNYKNYTNNYSTTNFQSKVPTKPTQTLENVKPAVVSGIFFTALANIKVFFNIRTPEVKPTEETVPPMPTKENILSELEEPLVIEGITVLDPKTKDLKFDTASLDEIIKNKSCSTDYIRKNGKYNEIHIYRNDVSGAYSIIFCHPSKNAMKDAMYQIKIRPNGEVRYISKASQIVFNEKYVLSKYTNVSPEKISKTYYSHGDHEIGVEYKPDETGKIEIFRYHNPDAEDLPNCLRFPYNGEINDETMVKTFSKLYK